MLTKRPECTLKWLKSEVAISVQDAIQIPGTFHLELLSLLKRCGLEKEWEFIVEAIDKRDRSDAHTKFPLPNVLFGASVEIRSGQTNGSNLMHQLNQQGGTTFISANLLEELTSGSPPYPVLTTR
jgi:hypothetical protein